MWRDCLTIYVLFIASVSCNLYFPELYEDALYKPRNLGPQPLYYQTTTRANTTIVEWSLMDDELRAEAKFSEDQGSASCALARLNFGSLSPDECKAVQNALLVADYTYLVSLQCKLKNRVLLIRLSSVCLSDTDRFNKYEIVYTAFDNKR